MVYNSGSQSQAPSQASDLDCYPCCCHLQISIYWAPSRPYRRELCHLLRRLVWDRLQSVLPFDHLVFCIGLPTLCTKSDRDLLGFNKQTQGLVLELMILDRVPKEGVFYNSQPTSWEFSPDRKVIHPTLI